MNFWQNNKKTRGATGLLSLWQMCLDRLEGEVSSQQYNTWLRPLKAVEDGPTLRLQAPNRFIHDWVNDRFLGRIQEIAHVLKDDDPVSITLEVANKEPAFQRKIEPEIALNKSFSSAQARPKNSPRPESNLNKSFIFQEFVEGKSNQLAKAAAQQVAENPGETYNPLFIYGGVGLGKTHLMQAVGNAMLANKPDAHIVYLHSERFVADMVKALQHNAIDNFKRYYRTVDALLIDDIQFFANKERSQEEFFHTFNTLLEGQKQIILTSDRYPKEVTGLEERLKSRLGWGLTVAIEPPELETRVAILMQKCSQLSIELDSNVAFFIAQRIRSNVRELEGALRRIVANANFTGERVITIDFAKKSLSDLLALQDKLVTIENIQKTVAEYFKIRISDLHASSRSRSVARPRQVAMALSKELTSHSLPEIGNAFGGRDHTTVLHACKRINNLRTEDSRVEEDYKNLLRILST